MTTENQSKRMKQPWKSWKKVLFRFIFLYVCLYAVFMFVGFLLEPILSWIGQNIFGLTEHLELKSTGSGDGVMSYLSLFLQFVISLMATLVWSIIDRKRISYNDLQFWFMSMLRIFVAIFMLLYGFAKVFLIQFQTPRLTTLVQQVGEMSPMGLAWTFMGFHPMYTIFTGLLEVFAGLFLIFRPTKTLGALMTVGVMTHVAVMNLCFDIPVKIFSIHLVLMGLILLFSDRRKIMMVFFGQKVLDLHQEYHPMRDNYLFNKIVKIKGIITGILMVAILAFGFFVQRQQSRRQNERDAYYGLYEVQDFKRMSTDGSKDLSNVQQWHYVVIEHAAKANIRTKDSVHPFHFIMNPDRNTATLYRKNTDSIPPNFHLLKTGDHVYEFHGKIEEDSIHFKMKPADLKQFPLISRGFHWINESPFNR